MRVITIEREFGAGGSVIADRLARRLGWKLFDESLTQEIAKLARVDPVAARRCDERRDPFIYRLAKVFARGSYERILPVDEPGVFDTDRMVALVQRVISDAASTGNCVIVGRGAPWILRERADAFHVFLYAPRDQKIARVVTFGKSAAEAAELVDSIDRERADFIKHYFGKEWPSRHLYHLMINTTIGDDATLDTILSVMKMAEISAREKVSQA